MNPHRGLPEDITEAWKVDPAAILLYCPSRLDPTQKGIHLLEDIARRFVIGKFN